MKGLGFRSTLQSVGSMAARTIPRNELSKKMHVSLGETFFLCMRSFELIRYEVWIWNIYIYIYLVYMKDIWGLGCFSRIRSTTKSHTNETPIFFSIGPCLSADKLGPPPPRSHPTSLWTNNISSKPWRFTRYGITGWWFQPIWKVLVKLGIFPK